jgi:hypothetical protein
MNRHPITARALAAALALAVLWLIKTAPKKRRSNGVRARLFFKHGPGGVALLIARGLPGACKGAPLGRLQALGQ